jgi:hypothetical protein
MVKGMVKAKEIMETEKETEKRAETAKSADYLLLDMLTHQFAVLY